MGSLFRIIFASSLFIIVLVSSVFGQSTGSIVGAIVDKETGEAIIGGNVYLEDTDLGAATDFDGSFAIHAIPAGRYTLLVDYVGYAQYEVIGIDITAGEVNKMSIAITQESLSTEEVVVEAKALKNTEANLLKEREKSIAIKDVVSAEAIARSGSDNAADAVKQITGISIVGGNEVFVRGLGDRYTSTSLNGSEIPSSDPYKRSGSIDLIPTSLVDNIVAIKSYTPDQPGTFSGGIVDIRTKDFPDQLTLSASTSASYNTAVSFVENGGLTYPGGTTDWMGYDDGTRSEPSSYANLSNEDLQAIESAARSSNEGGLVYNELLKSFGPTMHPNYTTFGVSPKLSFTVGNQISLFGKPLGFMASYSYSRKYTGYQNGESNSWALNASSIDATDALVYNYKYKQDKGVDEVLWGALLKTTYKIGKEHFLSLDYVYNRNAESYSVYLAGESPYDDENDMVFNSGIGYKERDLSSLKLSGKHNFSYLFDLQMEWAGAKGKSQQDEPDIRFLRYNRGIGEFDNGTFFIKNTNKPRRFYRDVEEDRNELKIDFKLPFQQFAGLNSNIKFGALASEKLQDYSERNYFYRQPTTNSGANIFNSITGVIGIQDRVGLWNDDTDNTRYYDMGYIIERNAPGVPAYNAEQTFFSYYGMIDMPIFERLCFIGGARSETIDMNVNVFDPLDPDKDFSDKNSNFSKTEILPAAVLIFQLADKMNLRFSYGKTLALPSFRELVPAETYEFIGGIFKIGNPDLKPSLIHSYDVRWEWYTNPGEILGVSVFYKDFIDPIETKYRAKEKQMTWDNVPEANIYGVEFEARKNLRMISGAWSNFSLGGNLVLVYSQVDIPDFELREIRNVDPNASSTRTFQGQSPYVLNMNLNYDYLKWGLNTSLFYNVFGERLAFTTGTATPDVFEQPFHSLNFSFKINVFAHLEFGFKVKNILDSEHKFTQEFKGIEYIHSLYKNGISYSFGFKYRL